MTLIDNDSRLRAGNHPQDFQLSLLNNLYYQRGTTIQSASRHDIYYALALTVRDRLVDRFTRTAHAHYEANPRFVYYLSAEYMLGAQLRQNLLYAGAYEVADAALKGLGLSLAELEALDVEPALGNGGLGRLAACYLDALATADIPAVGYGIRYDFGIFSQQFERGAQVERPDDWTYYGYPWEFPAPDDHQTVGFGGHTEPVDDDPRGLRRRWIPGETVLGEPSHMFVPGFDTATANIIRLWRARAVRQSFNLQQFGAGRYGEAVDDIVRCENISKVLYPDDSTDLGRELRLKQQYFLVSCSLRDIIRRYRLRNSDWHGLPDKVTVQLNDTHPVMAIVELMRLLVDEHAMDWDDAWALVQRTFAYTCHTLLPEALETWPVSLVGRLLPRHMEIIYTINHLFLQQVAGDESQVRDLSIIQEGPEQRIRMAHLAVVGSSAVNGVAELHSRLLTKTTLRPFADLWPDRFRNVTNGVSPRRFLALANPRLTDLVADRLGGRHFLTDLDQLAGLVPAAHDPAFREQWTAVKRANKTDLARHIERVTGVSLDPDWMFDVMIKRFHEYKRQLLKVLHVVTLYLRIRNDAAQGMVPRSVVFAGKAASSYHAAKRTMRLVNAVADVVNSDPACATLLRVAFLPDYKVTGAELVIPAADLSEQISMAGKEASGTSNMKLALNGAITIGTLDGANIEIRDRVGADHFFRFGLDADEAAAVRGGDYRPRHFYETDEELRAVVDAIASGAFSGGDTGTFREVTDDLLGHDEYLTMADYRAYVDCQDQVDAAWRDRDRWNRSSIHNTAGSGYFSADRAVREYCRTIWHVDPLPVPDGR